MNWGKAYDREKAQKAQKKIRAIGLFCEFCVFLRLTTFRALFEATHCSTMRRRYDAPGSAMNWGKAYDCEKAQKAQKKIRAIGLFCEFCAFLRLTTFRALFEATHCSTMRRGYEAPGSAIN
ncbi:MAG: hypothetical protein PHX38_01465, partial [Sulfuricella sp.]|nr:hypothetical protein [Sulfuricella sp.]